MKIAELFGKGKTVFSCEVFPPKKDSPVDTIYQTLDGLKDIKPDFISVTFGAGGLPGEPVHPGDRGHHPEAVPHPRHGPPDLHHRHQGEVTELLYDLKADGVENVLALRGDRNPDYPPKHGVPPRRRAGGLHPPAGGLRCVRRLLP